MKFKTKHYVIFAIVVIVCVALIVANCICARNAQAITNLLCGSGLRFEGEEVAQASAAGDELVQDVCDEGIILLKNEGGEDGKGILPLAETNRKLNLFGWSSIDNGFVLTGSGSATSPIQDSKKFTLRTGLESQGFEVNTNLLSKYESFTDNRHENSSEYPFPLVEPDRSWYTQDIINDAKAFSDTALITFTRRGGEGMEIPRYQKKWNASSDMTRTYLQLSLEEEDLIDLVTENFDKVIVLIDCSNPIELGFLDNAKIDAALNVGHPGQSGTKAIGRILKGDVNPSARTVDTYAYDWRSAPSFANSEVNDLQVTYAEGIYVGYKWYETAFADKVKIEAYGKTFDYSTEESYRNVVKYPFGYGLSYTSFEWNVESANIKVGEEEVALAGARVNNKYASIEVKVAVTNTGDVAGKEVVQLYYSAPYTKGGIEKPALTLADFEKTTLLEPGMTETLTLSFDLYDMASFDCYDMNGNGVATYELDAGNYNISLRDNAHEVNACENAVVEFSLTETLTYKLDPETKQIVKTRFTGESAYGGVPIDGSTAGNPITYVSRDSFTDTFPVEAAENRTGSNVKKANSYIYDGYEGADAPMQGQNGDLRIWMRVDGSYATASDLKGTSGQELKLNEELVLKLGQNYNASEYEQLLNQITISELFNLVESSGYATDEIVSIGKALNRDPDGPGGLSNFFGAIATLDSSSWTGYFSETMLAATFSKSLAFQFGRAVGNEGATTGVSGWYAPGANTHRTPYFGRYFEYYSEDEVLSGNMAAYTIRGAASANMYCYVKHFALSEMGINPRKTNVWITEQALRESYLRAFEIAVKEGEANAVMSAFNHIGGTWAGGNKALLTDILRTEWGFRGTVITDWSEGEDYMLPKQGIRAGNDIWLNPNDSVKNPLDRNDSANIYLARNSAHNVIYTICNTYYRFTQYDPADGEFVATVGIRNVDKVFPWWIPVLVSVDVIIFGVAIFEIVWILVHARKDYLKARVVVADSGGEEFIPPTEGNGESGVICESMETLSADDNSGHATGYVTDLAEGTNKKRIFSKRVKKERPLTNDAEALSETRELKGQIDELTQTVNDMVETLKTGLVAKSEFDEQQQQINELKVQIEQLHRLINGSNGDK